MSKAKNQVIWCINKAQKEIEQGKKHRGLVNVEPNISLARRHLSKAEHNMKAFEINKEHGFHDWCISIGFYVMYHCCLSILAKFGYETRNQECTLALIESLLEDKKIPSEFQKYIEAIKSQDHEDEILQMRETYQYTPLTETDQQKIEKLQSMAQEMIQETKILLEK